MPKSKQEPATAQVEEPCKSKTNKRKKYCSVPKCRHSKLNASSNSSGLGDLKLHRLPENKCVREKWFEFLKKYNVYSKHVSVSYLLCGDHFEESCFSRDLKSELLYNKPQIILQTGSIPTIYLKPKRTLSSENCPNQTIDDILKEYEDTTEDFVTVASKNILRLKWKFCCIINCESDNRSTQLFSVEKFKLLHKIPNRFIDNNRSNEYICIKHFDKKYLTEVQIFRKDSDFKINLTTDYDLINDAVPTIFTELSNPVGLPATSNCNDEIELEFDKLIATKIETEQVETFDLPEINVTDANIIARNKICRICFSTTNVILKSNILGKFQKVKNSLKFKITDLGKLFEEAFNLKVLEVPNCMNVCAECNILLESFENFKSKALKSNKQFLEIFHNIDWMDIELEKLSLTDIKTQAERKTRKNLVEKQNIDCTSADDTYDSLSNLENIEKSIIVNPQQKIESGIDSTVVTCDAPQPIGQAIITKRPSRRKILSPKTKNTKLSKNKCPHCPRILTTSYFLQLHIERIHLRNLIENRTCKICNKILHTFRSLRVHMETVHSDSYRFFCEVCGKGFKRSTNLDTHKVIHTNIRRFSCTISGCGKNFKRSSHLKQHLTYHEIYKAEKEKCEICGREVRSSLMNEHKIAHEYQQHQLTNDCLTSEGRYKCSKCERNYKYKPALRRHLRLFHGEVIERMYICSRPACKFRCPLKKSLLSHERKHLRKSEICLDTKQEIHTEDSQITDTFLANQNECSNQFMSKDIDNILLEDLTDDKVKDEM